jgi:magnesium transporter
MKKQKLEIEEITPVIETAHYGAYSMVNIKKTGKKQIQFLREEFNIEISDLSDTLPTLQRPKITIREEYIFMVLLFPVEDKNSLSISTAKVDLFIFKDMFVLMHDEDLEPLQILRESIEHYAEENGPARFTPQQLVPWILLDLYGYCMPISNRVANAIDQLEEIIFSQNLGNRTVVKTLFDIEREVVDFRKIMRSHTMIMDKLATVLPEFTSGQKKTALLQDMTEYPRVLWTNLESHVEAVDTLRQTYESLSAFFLNDILKNLTIFSIIIAPMTLIASIFGMNFKIIPFAQHPFGFIGTICFMVLISLAAFVYFKKKRWI